MEIRRNEKFEANELNNLLDTNNWRTEPVEKLERAINSSWGWVTVRNEEGKLIGFVHALSDCVRHAYITRMIVHPDYRNKGIGTIIMKELLNMLREENLYPTLVATPGKVDFYRQFGFETESNGLTAMCIRKPY